MVDLKECHICGAVDEKKNYHQFEEQGKPRNKIYLCSECYKHVRSGNNAQTE